MSDQKSRGGIIAYFVESLPGYLALAGTVVAALPWPAYYESIRRRDTVGEALASHVIFWAAIVGAVLWTTAIWLDVSRGKQRSFRERGPDSDAAVRSKDSSDAIRPEKPMH